MRKGIPCPLLAHNIFVHPLTNWWMDVEVCYIPLLESSIASLIRRARATLEEVEAYRMSTSLWCNSYTSCQVIWGTSVPSPRTV